MRHHSKGSIWIAAMMIPGFGTHGRCLFGSGRTMLRTKKKKKGANTFETQGDAGDGFDQPTTAGTGSIEAIFSSSRSLSSRHYLGFSGTAPLRPHRQDVTQDGDGDLVFFPRRNA
jgi:hypothetical protein